jgi:hypothetical protein
MECGTYVIELRIIFTVNVETPFEFSLRATLREKGEQESPGAPGSRWHGTGDSRAEKKSHSKC